MMTVIMRSPSSASVQGGECAHDDGDHAVTLQRSPRHLEAVHRAAAVADIPRALRQAYEKRRAAKKLLVPGQRGGRRRRAGGAQAVVMLMVVASVRVSHHLPEAS